MTSRMRAAEASRNSQKLGPFKYHRVTVDRITKPEFLGCIFFFFSKKEAGLVDIRGQITLRKFRFQGPHLT